jgi:hypothetical protein
MITNSIDNNHFEITTYAEVCTPTPGMLFFIQQIQK